MRPEKEVETTRRLLTIMLLVLAVWGLNRGIEWWNTRPPVPLLWQHGESPAMTITDLSCETRELLASGDDGAVECVVHYKEHRVD